MTGSQGHLRVWCPVYGGNMPGKDSDLVAILRGLPSFETDTYRYPDRPRFQFRP